MIRCLLLAALLVVSGFPQAVRAKRIAPISAPLRDEFEKQPRIAVLVGISGYPDGSGLEPLKYPTADVDELAQELGKQGYTVRKLTDGQATRGIITRTLSQISGVMDPDQGTLLFYFSGHGFAEGGVNYLATYGVTIDDLKRDGLALTEVEQLLKRSRAKRQVLWVDACRNVAQTGARAVGVRSFSGFDAAEGLRVLYSTRAGSVSYEDDSVKHGVFTYFLLRGLRGDAAGVDGLVTFSDLAGYVSSAVLDYGIKTGKVQRPFESAFEASGDFLLASTGSRLPINPAPSPVTAPRPAPPVTAGIGEKSVLTVGDDKLSAAGFDRLVKGLPAEQQAAVRGTGKRAFAEQLADLKVLALEAARRGLDRDPGTIAELGFNREDILAKQMFDRLQQRVQIDESAIAKYYRDHPNDSDTVEARHILIRVRGAPMPAVDGRRELSDDEALAKAQSVRSRLLAGEDFAAVARQESDDTTSAAQGGSLGTFRKGMMVPPFEQAAFSQAVGEIGQPVKSPFGYHIIRVESHKAINLNDASVKAGIEAKLRPELARQQVEELKARVKVSIDEAFFASSQTPADSGRVVLTIGDETLTAAQYDRLVAGLPAQYQAFARGAGKRQFADNLVQLKVLAREAENSALAMDSQQELMFNRQNILARKMFEQLTANVPVAEDSIAKYFREHPNDFSDSVEARHILIRVKGAPMPAAQGRKELSDEEALAKARSIQRRLLAGEDFASVAKAESDDTGSAAQGGSLGSFRKGMMVPPFEQAAFSQRTGEVGPPVKSPFGYHIIVVDSRHTASLNDKAVRSDIEAKLRPELARAEVARLRAGVRIEIDDAFFGPATGNR